MSTLRTQRRLRTTAAIRKVAVDLACQHGLDSVTVEMISAAAGISPRTFFNYFPFREAAFLPPEPKFSDAQLARFAQGRGTLGEDLLTLLTPILEALGDDGETLRKCHELAQTAPRLLALSNSIYVKFDDAIRDALAKRLQATPESADLRHLAALITATIKCGLGQWVLSGTGSATQNLHDRLVALPALATQIGLREQV